jgi:GNAT superfamily N-acetyltransferase
VNRLASESHGAVAILTFPIVGSTRQAFLPRVESLPEPWRSHAFRCLDEIGISVPRMETIVEFGHTGQIIANMWISLPDSQLIPKGARCGVLQHVWVHRNRRGRGVGTCLVRRAIRHLTSMELDGVMLATGELRLRNGFYGKLGFQPVGRDKWLLNRRLTEGRSIHDLEWPELGSTFIKHVGPYDLASAQSMCGRSHWFVRDGRTRRSGPIEIEEQFCYLFNGGGIPPSFLGRLPTPDARTQALFWTTRAKGGCQHRLFGSGLTRTAARSLADQIESALEPLFSVATHGRETPFCCAADVLQRGS